LQLPILLAAEKAKIELSVQLKTGLGVIHLQSLRRIHTSYLRDCPHCLRKQPADHPDATQSCLGCLLLKHNFLQRTQAVLDAALDQAVQRGAARSEVVKVLVTGGTSLLPCVTALLNERFTAPVECQNPFDAVARGACRGDVSTVLQHHYAIESYNPDTKTAAREVLFRRGQAYPTKPEETQTRLARGVYEDQERVALVVWEVMGNPAPNHALGLVDEHGRIRPEVNMGQDQRLECLNQDNPTFILAQPPVNLNRDRGRFLCRFSVDGQRRLLVTVQDNFSGKQLYLNHPVVRL